MTGPFQLSRLTQPDIEPVTLAEMKKHLRAYADITEEDTLISSLITSAREWYEKRTHLALIDQQWEQSIESYCIQNQLFPNQRYSFDAVPPEAILLRRSPVIAITAFVSVGADGTETEFDAATYRLDDQAKKWPRIVPIISFGTNVELRIRFRAGFANRLGSPTDGVEKVPETAKQAIKLYAEALYDRDKSSMALLISTAESLADQESANLGIA